MKVSLCHNGDDVFIAWKPAGCISECRGFALLRRRNGVEETVSTWVGFEDDKASDGERRASTNWPIQKYQWTYAANIMAIYNQYCWRFRRQAQPQSKRWKGLKDADTWQGGYLKKGSAALREIDSWIGT